MPRDKNKVPSEIRVVEHDGYVEFVATGPSDSDLVIAHLDSFFAERDDRCVMWNVVDCDLSTFKAEDFPAIVEVSVRSFGRRQAGARTGVLVGKDADRFLLRAFAARSETMSDLPLRIFEDRDEAVVWVVDD